MNKVQMKLLGATLIGLLLLTGCGNGQTENETEEVDLSLLPRTVEAFGRVHSGEERTVLLEFGALVEQVHVREGEIMEAGDPIFTLDLSDPLADVQAVQSQVERARMESRVVRDQINSEGRNLLNRYRDARAQEQRLTEALRQTRKLYQEGAVSRMEQDREEQALEDLQRQMAHMERELQVSYGVRPQDNPTEFLGGERGRSALASDRQASSLEAELSTVRGSLSSPFLQGSQVICDLPRGVIYDIGYAPGERTVPGNRAFRLVDVNRLVVEADILEEFIRDIQVGQKVDIVPVADRTRVYQGTVQTIAHMAFARNGETVVPVEIEVDNQDGFLRPNFNVDILIHLED